MALSGVFYGTTNNSRIKPRISWEAVQSISGNYSDVTAKLEYICSGLDENFTGSWNGTLSINGEAFSKTVQLALRSGATVTALTKQVRVYHDDNGNQSIRIIANGAMGTSADAPFKTTTISGSITLDTIPRPSEILATSGNIGGTSVITVKKKNSSLTHSIAYRFGALTGFVSYGGRPITQAEIFSGTVVNFAVPESFYAQIPGSPTGKCTLTCNTYQGSTLVGSHTTTFTVTAQESLCLPAVSLAVADVNAKTVALTGNAQVLVLNASTARCTLTATAKNSATVAKRMLQGKSVGEVTDFASVATGKFTYSATDSRGYCTEKIYTASTISYLRPTVNASVKRTSPTADTAALKVTGKCFHGSFGAAQNTLYLQVFVAGKAVYQGNVTLKENNTYQLSMTLTGLSYQQSYDVRVVGTDKLYAAEKTVTLSAGVPVFDWGENDFQFHVPVNAVGGLQINGVSLLDWVYPVGSVYISFHHTNPGTWLGGTWTRILGQGGSDVFLCGCAATDTTGTFGGSANGLADQIGVSSTLHGGILTEAGTGSFKGRVMITRNGNYTNTSEEGTKLLSVVGAGDNYLNKNLPPFVKVSMWRRTA